VKPPRDGWDRDERDAIEALGKQLTELQDRHAGDPSVDLLRAAHGEALPEPMQEYGRQHLANSPWSRTLVEDLDGAPISLDENDTARLLKRIRRDARRAAAPRLGPWPWGVILAATSAILFLIAGTSLIMSRFSRPQPGAAAQPQTTVAVATPPASAPVFQLALETPDIKLSPAALTWRGSGSENHYLADLKPAFDAFRSGDYAAADRAFSGLSAKYPAAIEVPFYQGVSRLFLNDVAGAVASLTKAERVADSSFAWDVGWYRSVAEERAGDIAAARDQLSRLCRMADVRAPTACDALKRIPQH
jgi:hypothetical protein